MNSSRKLRGAALPTAAVLAVAALFAALGGGVLGRDADPDPSPSPSPTPTAPAAPSMPVPFEPPAPSMPVPSAPAPTVPPSADPTAPGGPLVIDLDDATGHDVSVVVDDGTGTVVDGASDRPGDGMSVRWGEVLVENLDPRVIRLTWAGYPRDETVRLAISRDADGYHLRIAQGMPYPNTDAMGQDRVLVLAFDEAISAGDIEAFVHDPSFLDD
jgi:hypothetical protein